MVIISSHSDARYSKLNGTEHADNAAALAALQALADGELATYDAGEELVVYASQEDCDADTDNSLSIARIEKC